MKFIYIYFFLTNTLALNTYYVPGTLLVAGKQMAKTSLMRVLFFFSPALTY